MIKQIFWRGLVFLRLTLPKVTNQLLVQVSSVRLLLSGTDTGGGDATDRTVQTENRKNIKKRETFMFTIFM